MKLPLLPLVFIIGGIVVMALELIVPGLVVVFFGAGALIVGLLGWAGVITGIESMLVAWMLLSLVLVLVFRRFALKLFPADSSYQLVEDDVDAIGRVVDVVTTVGESGAEGRIFFNGTSWPATSSRGTIAAGKHARIVYRNNISWVVEPLANDGEQR